MSSHLSQNNLLKWIMFLLPAAILGSLGCLLLHLYATGDLTFLQHQRFHPFTLVTGWMLILCTLFYPLMYDPENAPIRGSYRSILFHSILCALPVVLALLYPINYDLTTLTQRLEHRPFDATMLVPDNEKNAIPQWVLEAKESGFAEPSLLDLIVAAQIPDARAYLEGLEVTLKGQWLADTADSFRFVRLLMFCCAADARPIGLTVQGTPPNLDSGAWIQLRGKLHLEPEGKKPPTIEAISIEPTDAPEDAFIY